MICACLIPGDVVGVGAGAQEPSPAAVQKMATPGYWAADSAELVSPA
jgi:hypothetical protein